MPCLPSRRFFTELARPFRDLLRGEKVLVAFFDDDWPGDSRWREPKEPAGVPCVLAPGYALGDAQRCALNQNPCVGSEQPTVGNGNALRRPAVLPRAPIGPSGVLDRHFES